MLQLSIDNSGDIFAPSKTTIADLAQYSFNDRDSHAMHIYAAAAIVERDWRDELADMEMEYCLGITATFKDGSKLLVSAWADCCEGGGCKHCRGH